MLFRLSVAAHSKKQPPPPDGRIGGVHDMENVNNVCNLVKCTYYIYVCVMFLLILLKGSGKSKNNILKTVDVLHSHFKKQTMTFEDYQALKKVWWLII
jgi:hypothetical protein